MSTPSFGSALAVYETQPDNVSEFTRHPNSHIVSAFFSGLVFWGSLCHLLRSPFAHYIKRRIACRISTFLARHRFQRGIQSESDSEAQNLFKKDAALRDSGDKVSLSESIFRRQDNPTLIFVLTLLFFMSGLSQFASSLVFSLDLNGSSVHDQTFCAFLIAWDSMSFQSARLIGLIVLGLNLSSLGVKWKEIIVFWIVIAAIAVLIIVANTLQIGILNESLSTIMIWQHGPNKVIALCYRQHNLAPSLVLSLIAIGLEIYCIIRLLHIIAPPSFPLQRILNALSRDIRIVRGISLLVFDLIVLVPNSITTTYLGDSVPFSISALIVLATFNDYHPPLPLFHQVTAQETNKASRLTPDSDHLVRYKALVVSPHPYSAAALSMNASRPDMWRTEGYSGLTTTSGSGRRLLVQAVTSSTYVPSNTSNRDKIAPGRPVLPLIPTEKPSQPRKSSRSPSKSRSRTGPHRTRASSRSQKSHLVRPIIPKAELARQFNDNERTADLHDAQILAPRPPVYTHNRLISAPIKSPPPATLLSNSSRARRYSAAESMAQTLGSVSTSIHYGSDILRPEPGRTIRDRMRASAGTRAQNPLTTRMGSLSESGTSVLSRGNSQSQSRESWLSDRTIDAYTVARLAPPVPSMPTFNGGWPVPPSAIPAARVPNINDRRGHLGLPSHPSQRMAAPAVSKLSLDRADELEISLTSAQAVVRGSRPPESVRGPRMQFPPPRSRTSRT